jgi:DNA-binding NarL/FixJ family response regulator
MRADRSVLTLGEARVARLVAEGRTDEEVAAQLGLSVDEIERALVEALHKLELRSRTELALLLIPPLTAPTGDDAGRGEPGT